MVAIIAGLMATSLMTPVAYLSPAFRLQQLDFAAMLGSLVTNQATPPLSGVWIFGMLLHFVKLRPQPAARRPRPSAKRELRKAFGRPERARRRRAA